VQIAQRWLLARIGNEVDDPSAPSPRPWSRRAVLQQATYDALSAKRAQQESVEVARDLLAPDGCLLRLRSELLDGAGESPGSVGDLVGVSSESLGVAGELLDAAGELLGVAGELLDAAGELLGVTGESLGVTGELLGVTGELLGVTGESLGVISDS